MSLKKRCNFPVLKTLSVLVSLLLLGGCHFVRPYQSALYDYHHHRYATAFYTFRDLALRGNVPAMYTTGYLYYYGIGIAEDEDMARVFIHMAAKRNYPPAVIAYEKLINGPTEVVDPASTKFQCEGPNGPYDC